MPPRYRVPIDGTPIYGPAATAGEIVDFGDGQTSKLAQANGRTSDVIAIVDTCDKRTDDIAKALAPKPWWKFWG